MLAKNLEISTSSLSKSLSMIMVGAFLAVLTLTFTSLSPTEASAKKYKRHHQNSIRIESRFSPNKYIIAPVRRNYHGDREVRLPTGQWINCAKNCRWTVQKEYLDFWEYQQNPFGPGYIRFERSFN